MRGFERREALIPMMAAGGTGALARLCADDHLPEPHPAKLARRLSELYDCGLYTAGKQAEAAVRTLTRRGAVLFGRAIPTLSVVNPGDVVGLAEENSASAELGLAACLLLYQSQSPVRVVLASGSLDLSGRHKEVAVSPVAHLPGKLRLIARHFSQRGSALPPRMCLVPAWDPGGARVSETYQEDIAALRALSIEVRPVQSLAEAAELLSASRLAVRRVEQWFRRGVAVTAATAALTAGASAWLNRTLTLRFAATAAPDGSIVSTPARVIGDKGWERMVSPCMRTASRPPAFETGSHVALRVLVDEPQRAWTAPFAGYHFIAVAIPATSDVQVLEPKPQINGTAYWNIAIGATPEPTTLMVLAKRGRPFDRDALRRALNLLRKPSPTAPALEGPTWDSVARYFLRGYAPGALTYRFESVAAECS